MSRPILALSLLLLALSGLLCSCSSAGGTTGDYTYPAYLPYIEAVEFPAQIPPGELFTVRIKVSAAARPSLLRDCGLELQDDLLIAGASLRPYLSRSRAHGIDAEGWCSLTVRMIGLPPSTEAKPLTIPVMSADSREAGGVKGTITIPNGGLWFPSHMGERQFEAVLGPTSPETP